MKMLIFILSLCTIEVLAQQADKPLTVRYFARSGWLVETEKHMLVMDYVPYDGVQFDDFVFKALLRGKSQNKSLFVFISHEHEDHFYPKLFEWANKMDNLQVVLGWHYPIEQANVHKLAGRDSTTIQNVKVWVHPATDAGSGFLIKMEDMTIYHAGDHAQWANSVKSDFEKETKYIVKKGAEINLAFLPVENRRKQVMDGALSAVEILKPAHVFPMHSDFKDYSIFADKVKTKLPKIQIYPPQYFNQSFSFTL